ncbi:MAG TPA: kelch repeat-containing protein [Tepidisphaeraceae bacterium]|jgi:hypothetical protein
MSNRFFRFLSVGCVVLGLLSGTSRAANDFSVRINFAPESAPDAPGYRIDYGAEYGRRSNGLTYGWNRDKRSDTSYEQSEYDTVRGDARIAFYSGDSWSIAVPDGWYAVRALSGDPFTLEADYRLNVEGQPLLKGKPYPGFPFIEGLTTVKVTDGRLTVTSAPRAAENRLNAIQIAATDPPTAVPAGVNISWTRDDSVRSPVARVESAVVRMGDLLVVMGGFTDQYLAATRRVDVLNTKTGEWTRWADLPGPETHIAAATDGRYIYAAGGQTGPLLSDDLTAAVYRYDPKRDVWEPFGELPEIRAGAQMQYVNKKLHVIGGDDETRVVAQSSHYVLDPKDPDAGWQEAAPLPVATDHHSSIVVNGDMYILGGEIDHGTSYITRSDFFVYQAGADKWVRLPDMPSGLSHQEASTLTDGRRIIAIAGQADVQQISGLVYSYDIARGVWEQHTSLPTPRKGGVAWLDGKVLQYFAGDDDKFGQPTWSYKGVIQD